MCDSSLVLDILKLSSEWKDCEIRWFLCFAQISGVLALSKGLSQNFGNSCPSRNRKSRSDHERYARTHVIFVIDRDRLRDWSRSRVTIRRTIRKRGVKWLRNGGECLRETREDAKMRGARWIWCRRKFSASSWRCCHYTMSLARFVWSPGRCLSIRYIKHLRLF